MVPLKDTNLFQNIAQQSIEQMMRCTGAITKEYNVGDYIFREEDKPQFLFLILEGGVSIVKDFASGRQDILYVATQGEIFGEDFFGKRKDNYWFNAVANSKTILLLLPWEFFCGFCNCACEHHQQIIQNILEIVAAKNFDMKKKAHILSSTTLREKIIVWLIESAKEDIVMINMNREQMAAYLGVTRPSLSRELMKMQKEGIISISRTQIKIENLELLEEM